MRTRSPLLGAATQLAQFLQCKLYVGLFTGGCFGKECQKDKKSTARTTSQLAQFSQFYIYLLYYFFFIILLIYFSGGQGGVLAHTDLTM